MVARLEVRFAERPGRGAGKRPVREIVGVDAPLLRMWSSRRRGIDVRRGALAADFQREHHRPPTTAEAIALAHRATLETREAKHEPRSLAEQRATWRREAIAVLGDPLRLDRMLDRALSHRPSPRPPRLTRTWVASAAARVLDTPTRARCDGTIAPVAAASQAKLGAAFSGGEAWVCSTASGQSSA